MANPVVIQNWGLGLNTDAMPSELPPGYCTDCTDFRFRNGEAESVGQADPLPLEPNPTVTPYWIGLYGNTANVQFHIHAGIAKVFANDFTGASTEITRYTDGVEIVSITFVGTTATVTTASAHGRSVADPFTVFAALPTDYNVTGTIATVPSPTTFTYTMATTPATNATYMGGYSYNVTSNFTGAIDDRWTGGTINGIFFLNNPVNGLYYWNGDTTTRLRKMPGSSAAPVCRAFKNYLIQIHYRYVKWSSAAAPGDIPLYWTASATNDAGEFPASETQGVLVDCLPLGDVNIIYGRDSRYAMRWIGGQANNSIFSIQRLPGTDGVRGVSCVVDTPKGHVFLTQNLDVKIHSGGQTQSLAEGRVRTALNTINTTYRQRAFLCVNPPFNEVWVFFNATGGSGGAATTALIWSWNDDTWGKSPVSAYGGITFAASGLLSSATSKNYMLMTDTQPKIRAQDLTQTPGARTYFIERIGLSLGDEDAIKDLQRSKWSINSNDATGTTVLVSHGSSKYADVAPTYVAVDSFAHRSTVWASKMATGGRFLAVKASFLVAASGTVRFKTVYIDVTKSGTV